MTTVDLLLQTLEIELAMTRRTLERIPEELAFWQPHPRSMPMGQLAMHVARLPDLMTLCLSTQAFDAGNGPAPDLVFASGEALLRTFDESRERLLAALAPATDDFLAQPWPFGAGGQIFSDLPRSVTLLHMGLGHLAYHRAQLGTYLRLNDFPVPPLYGPTADEKPQLRPAGTT